jgi:hypothetical protein
VAWADTGVALAALLGQVANVGPVYLGGRHLRDQTRLRDLFERVVPGARDRVRGWLVTRDVVEEEWWTQLRTRALERYRLRCFTALTDDDQSEKEVQALLDSVGAKFRPAGRASLGSAHVASAQSTGQVAYTSVGGYQCHYAEVEVAVEELYTIPSVAQPSGVGSASAAREDYADAAKQVADLVRLVAGAGVVYEQRPWALDQQDLLAKFLVDSDAAEEDDPTVKTVRTWRVYRASDVEARGLGTWTAGRAGWKVQHARSWSDSEGSYDAFQRHVDQVREKFRGIGRLGSLANTTQVLSSPLQVRELGARRLQGVTVHFADCELAVQEVVHA